MADEFYSFDEALDQLRLKEEELKRLVSEGEIRAFRKGDTMKLRRSDVENLRAELSGGEVVDLGESSEELVFEDDTDFGTEAGMATQEIADVDTLIDDDVEDVGVIDLGDEEPRRGVAAPVGRPGVRRTSVIGATAEDESEGAGMLFAMIATSAVLLLAMPIALSVSEGAASGIARTVAGVFGHSFD